MAVEPNRVHVFVLDRSLVEQFEEAFGSRNVTYRPAGSTGLSDLCNDLPTELVLIVQEPVTESQWQAVLAAAVEHGSARLVRPVVDTLKVVDPKGLVVATADRGDYRQAVGCEAHLVKQMSRDRLPGWQVTTRPWAPALIEA